MRGCLDATLLALFLPPFVNRESCMRLKERLFGVKVSKRIWFLNSFYYLCPLYI